MDIFNFILKCNVFFGAGARKKINDVIRNNDYKSLGVVVDHALLGLPIVDQFLGSIKGEIHIIRCDISEPTYARLEERRSELMRKHFDAYVGFGGGSAIDMAKGLSVLSTNHGSAISYKGFEKFTNPPLPIIAIPTTAGTGSEITPNASFIDSINKQKMGINGELIRPKFSFLDPELTISCPLGPTISAAVDSLVHATEAYVAKKTNPLAQFFSNKGFTLVVDNLPSLVQDLDDLILREKVMLGAFLSGVALMNSGTGPAAAMSYPLGVHWGVAHGIGGGIFLPFVIENNIKEGFFDYVGLYNNKNESLSKQDASNFILNKILELWKILKIPKNLKEYGFNEGDINKFVKDTMRLKGALDQNPTPFYEDEIIKTLNKLSKDY